MRIEIGRCPTCKIPLSLPIKHDVWKKGIRYYREKYTSVYCFNCKAIKIFSLRGDGKQKRLRK